MTQESYVLVVSDRPQQARLLAGGVRKAMACVEIAPGDGMPAAAPALVVIDLGDGHPDAGLWLERLRALRAPCLHLPRSSAGRGLRLPAPARAMAPGASRTSILAALFEIVDDLDREQARADQTQARRRSDRAAQARRLADRAGAVIAGVFDAAYSGCGFSVDAIDSGTEVILEAVSDCGIREWLETVGRYDEQLYQHSLSVAGFAAAFALELRLSRDDQMRVAKAALLHDVGKAKIPRAILNKPGKLTDAEMAIMRTHAAIGADMLAAQGDFDAAMLAVVRHHHEMLDGGGYPDSLSGDAIPDLVRLVTICDIHSALTERRAYRDPLPHQEAHAIMLGMGAKLDRALLTAFAPIVLRSAEPVAAL